MAIKNPVSFCDEIAKAFENRHKNPEKFRQFYIGGIANFQNKKYLTSRQIDIQEQKRKQTKRVKYFVGHPYEDIQLTRREAQCLAVIVRGTTNLKASEKLDLSIRTIEFYVRNLREKLDCKTKIELITKVGQSDFMKQACKIYQSIET